MLEMKKEIIKIIVISSLISILYLGIVRYVYLFTYTEKYEIKLYPLYDNVYVLYNKNHSNVPAQNYTEVTVSDGQMQYTYSGDINIVFDGKNTIDVETKPYVVNGDRVVLHIEKDTVFYNNSFSIS